MKKTIATLEAHMGSNRLPGKVMKEILGKPILETIVNRARGSHLLEDVVIITTTNPKDDVIVDLCVNKNISFYRGNVKTHVKDVLDQVLSGAKEYKGDTIVELISDNPLIDSGVIDKVVQYYFDNDYDYVSNFIPQITYPTGISVQVFPTKLLDEVDKLTSDPTDPEYIKNRENVTWYIYHHLEKYRIGTVEADEILRAPKIRLDLDQPEDFILIKTIYEHFNDLKVPLQDVLKYLKENPKLISINQKYLTGEEKYV